LTTTAMNTAFYFYQILWDLAMPLLRRNRRVAEGLAQRTLRENALERAELWIQAASVGESLLAVDLLNRLNPPCAIRVALTTNTRQGMDILREGLNEGVPGGIVTAFTAYFPFDAPRIMERAVETIQPKVMVLLETELWPGLLSALKKTGCRVVVINGRLNPKSLNRYRLWPALWKTLSPDHVLAVSEEDAERFGILFRRNRTRVVPNMKFDRVRMDRSGVHGKDPLKGLLPADNPFLVLGSTRKEEERDILEILFEVRRRLPETIIGLFPRHIHRIGRWKKVLKHSGIAFILRSEMTAPVGGGVVILWDTFGELSAAYERSTAVFIGGSLAPLGGQNFLEALASGVIPIIGPSWYDFAWVGREIVDRGLVRVVSGWREAADALVDSLENPRPRDVVRQMSQNYVKKRRGGTACACRQIEHLLEEHV